MASATPSSRILVAGDTADAVPDACMEGISAVVHLVGLFGFEPKPFAEILADSL